MLNTAIDDVTPLACAVINSLKLLYVFMIFIGVRTLTIVPSLPLKSNTLGCLLTPHAPQTLQQKATEALFATALAGEFQSVVNEFNDFGSSERFQFKHDVDGSGIFAPEFQFDVVTQNILLREMW